MRLFFFHGLFRGILFTIKLTILAFGSPNNELLPSLRQSKICIQMPAVTLKTFQILGKCTVFNVFNDAKLLQQNTKDFILHVSEKLERGGISSVSTLP